MVSRSAEIPRRAAFAALLIVLALGACGCFGQDKPAGSGAQAEGATGATDPAGLDQRAPIEIDSPRDGERVVVAGGVALVLLSGRGAAGEQISLGADGCGRRCEQEIAVGGNGIWGARLAVPAKPRGTLTVRARYVDAADHGDSASVTLKLGRGGASGGERGGSTSRRRLVMIGDSLALGLKTTLPDQLSSWSVSVDGRIGRPLAEGMRILARTDLPPAASSVLAMVLFTNDSPGNVGALRSAVQSSLSRVGSHGCVIWATVHAPPIGGVSYDAANRELRRLAGAHENMRLVDWAALVDRNPGLLEPDDVHPTAAGYVASAKRFARAARSCP